VEGINAQLNGGDVPDDTIISKVLHCILSPRP
jgi:hypothetical protein